MPSEVVLKSDVLDKDKRVVEMWEATQGIMSRLPNYLQGKNVYSLSMAFDRAIEYMVYQHLQRLNHRHVSESLSVDGLAYHELIDKCIQLGIPYIVEDDVRTLRTRIYEWFRYDYGGGTLHTIRGVLYHFIGSGTFLPYDGGNQISYLTNRIVLNYPVNNFLWGDYPTLDFGSWGDYPASGEHYWADANSEAINTIRLQILFGSFVDYYKWNQDRLQCQLHRLVEKIRPAGMVNTIVPTYAGSLATNLKAWYKFDGDGRDYTINLRNLTSPLTTVTYLSGVEHWGVTFGSGGFFEEGSSKSFTGTLSSFTISCFANLSTFDSGDNRRIQFFGDWQFASNIGIWFGIWKNASNQYNLTGVVTNGTTYFERTLTHLPQSKWNHYTMVHASGVTSIYVSGTNFSSSAGTTASVVAADGFASRVGKSNVNGFDFAINTFKIDELMLWDRNLTSAEINEIYEAGKSLNVLV
jgi:hypothetical protein